MTIDEIWAGDKLQRKQEALLLQRFLENETIALADMGRSQAFVLALDAQYGEGKSWFLSRLRDQLTIDHPVAFIDAWIDDANNEPLVSIMAALEDALQPFLTTRNVKEKLGNVMRAALPIMGKAALGAGSKFVGRYLGDQFGDDAKDAIAAAGKSGGKSVDDDSVIAAGVDKLFDGVSEVVDNAGKVLLDQYRTRQQSRETFRSNLGQLAASIEANLEDPRYAPIFVIVDELDRCRPSYAISLLEEIKHLFDVPGVVFVIALHGAQLEHSISAVYGQGFDAKSYLRRFFTRHYELRRLSIRELVKAHFQALSKSTQFTAPRVWRNNQIETMPPAELAGGLLSEWGTTPRETQAIIDALRLFAANWDYQSEPIELPLVLALLFFLVRGEPQVPMPARIREQEIKFVAATDRDRDANGLPIGHEAAEMTPVYQMGSTNSIYQLTKNNLDNGLMSYATNMAGMELQRRFGGRYNPNDPQPSTWAEYKARVRELVRFVEPVG